MTAKQTKNKVRHFEGLFCPLIKSDCRRDCAWLYLDVDITDDGITETANCAINEISDYISGCDEFYIA